MNMDSQPPQPQNLSTSTQSNSAADATSDADFVAPSVAPVSSATIRDLEKYVAHVIGDRMDAERERLKQELQLLQQGRLNEDRRRSDERPIEEERRRLEEERRRLGDERRLLDQRLLLEKDRQSLIQSVENKRKARSPPEGSPRNKKIRYQSSYSSSGFEQEVSDGETEEPNPSVKKTAKKAMNEPAKKAQGPAKKVVRKTAKKVRREMSFLFDFEQAGSTNDKCLLSWLYRAEQARMRTAFPGEGEDVLAFLYAVMKVITTLNVASRTLSMKPRYKLDPASRSLVVPDRGSVSLEYDRAKFTWAMAVEVLRKPSKEIMSSKYGFNIVSDGTSKTVIGENDGKKRVNQFVPLSVAYMIVVRNLDFKTAPNREGDREFNLLEILLFAVLLKNFDSGAKDTNMAFVYLDKHKPEAPKPSLMSVLVEHSLVREEIDRFQDRVSDYTEACNQILCRCESLFYGLIHWIKRYPEEATFDWLGYAPQHIAAQAQVCLKYHAEYFSGMAHQVSDMSFAKLDCSILPCPFDTANNSLLSSVKVAYKNNMTREDFLEQLSKVWPVVEVLRDDDAWQRYRDKYYVRRDTSLCTFGNTGSTVALVDVSFAAAKKVIHQSTLHKAASKVRVVHVLGGESSADPSTSRSADSSSSQESSVSQDPERRSVLERTLRAVEEHESQVSADTVRPPSTIDSATREPESSFDVPTKSPLVILGSTVEEEEELRRPRASKTKGVLKTASAYGTTMKSKKPKSK